MQKPEDWIGRDSLSLVEFPLGFLADRPKDGVKTLVFESTHGKLVITGADAYGLPTAFDTDVIVGLMALTKTRNNFTSATVPFTRYELMTVMDRPNDGRQYARLDDSLRRWAGVTLNYQGAWWEKGVKGRVDATFHILDDVQTFDAEKRRTMLAKGQGPAESTFTWGRRFFQSCQDGSLKNLDLATYFGLKRAVTKQLYRFLDKRFHSRREWTFDLHKLALGHVGLSPDYTPAKIKEKLRPALAELEAMGFLEAMSPAERYQPVECGRWKITLARGPGRVPTVPADPEPQVSP